MNEIQLGLLLMAYGLVGTFVALALFFLIIKLLGKIFPEKNKWQHKKCHTLSIQSIKIILRFLACLMFKSYVVSLVFALMSRNKGNFYSPPATLSSCLAEVRFPPEHSDIMSDKLLWTITDKLFIALGFNCSSIRKWCDSPMIQWIPSPDGIGQIDIEPSAFQVYQIPRMTFAVLSPTDVTTRDAQPFEDGT